MAPHKDNKFHSYKLAFERHHTRIINDFSTKHQKVLKKAKDRGLHIASAAIVLTSLLASSPSELHDRKYQASTKIGAEQSKSLETLKGILKDKNTLNQYEEGQVSTILSKSLGMNLKATLDGNKLNEIYGYTGAEQHLFRWPGDTLSQHNLPRAGIAPLKGAFGYFDNENQEKYYVAAQLHELPNWNTDWVTLKPWYRFRKVVVYNPDNGKAVVACIGDAGPARWTGKTFGGSPEVMEHLERVDGAQKGKVVILFVDDPDNQIALGPVIDNSALALQNK